MEGDYNLCHFWSNFEIADLNFWRGEAYTKYFEYLDQKGGFYYERWGDAPVHSLAAALFLNMDELHWFHDIGYKHVRFSPFLRARIPFSVFCTILKRVKGLILLKSSHHLEDAHSQTRIAWTMRDACVHSRRRIISMQVHIHVCPSGGA